MFTFLSIMLMLVGVVLGVVVLLQSGKGGGLAASFGGSSSSMDTFLGGRQAATLLTKASWVLGGLFLALALTLSIISTRARAPRSVLEGEFQPRTTEPTTPSPLLPVSPAEGGAQETAPQGAPPSPLQPAEGSAGNKP